MCNPTGWNSEMGFLMNQSILLLYMPKEGKHNSFRKSGVPRWDRWSWLFTHHPEIVQRKPQHLTKARAEAANFETLENWFAKVQSLFCFNKHRDFDETEIAKHLWNCDETTFCTAVAYKREFVKWVAKSVHGNQEGST